MFWKFDVRFFTKYEEFFSKQKSLPNKIEQQLPMQPEYKKILKESSVD